MKLIYLFYSSDTIEVKKENIDRVNYNLEKSWELIEPLFNLIYKTPKEVSIMHAAKNYIIELQNFDNTLYNFKFPFTKAIITNPVSENRIDVVNLKERIEELYHFFVHSDLLLERILRIK